MKEVLICDCNDPEHLILFLTVENVLDDDKLVFAEIHLVKRRFIKRLWYGIKYILGYRCKYGAFDEIVISKYNYGTLEKVVKYFKK